MFRQVKIKILSSIKKKLEPRFQAQIATTKLYGKLITVNINGRDVKMRHHSSGRKNAPVYIDIHGGGWAWGCIENGDHLRENFVRQLGIECYSVDYTLVPNAFYPTQVNELYEIVEYMHAHPEEFQIDPNRMIVGGRIAGGNLSAALCLMAKEKGSFQFMCQLLEYPAMDLTGTFVKHRDRYVEKPALPIWSLKLLIDSYASKKQQKEKFCSPLFATREELEGLPPTVIQTCEYDSVRLDGDLYAERLADAGVIVRHRCYPKAIHGFSEEETKEALDWQQYMIDFLKEYVQ